MDFKLWLENQVQRMANMANQTPNSSGFYHVLTNHGPDRAKQYGQLRLQDKEQVFLNLLKKLSSDLSSKGFYVSKSGWLHVQMPFKVNYGANYEGVDAFKSYRTFEPTANQRISQFIDALPGLADKLLELQNSDPNYPDRMQFKIPGNLNMFFNHHDSLVVHFRNKHNRQKVNSLINQYFSSVGINFENRDFRSSNGYDMNAKGDFQGGSHSELISQALEKLISKTPNYKLISPDKQQQWINQWMSYFNKLSPQAMYKYLTEN